MAAVPTRIQLRRSKGWRMPPNTVKVDRTTKWGNPLIVGQYGTQARCAELFELLLGGLLCVSADNIPAQRRYLAMAMRDRAELAGKNLACWCRPGTPCHAEVLLRLNAPRACTPPQRRPSSTAMSPPEETKNQSTGGDT